MMLTRYGRLVATSRSRLIIFETRQRRATVSGTTTFMYWSIVRLIRLYKVIIEVQRHRADKFTGTRVMLS